MADYDLYYWPVPFRGQFLRAILAYAGQSWAEHDAQEIEALMAADPARQPVPFMGAPVLIERESGLALSQMPAIALYLGDRLGLVEQTAQARALATKVVNDANDVIDAMTLDGGRQMWTQERWEAFQPRRWMTIWESMGARHGLTRDAGFLLGTAQAGLADIVTHVLWTTMADRFRPIAALLEEAAPCAMALARRMQAVPSLAATGRKAFADYGDAWCGGEIEQSLRKVLT